MGHRVSKPRYDLGYSAAGTASLAILLALLASSSADSSSYIRPSTSCCSCFVSQPQSINPWELPTSTTTTLHASSSTILTAKTVPPPNSRLGRLQQASSISQASRSMQRQPPGTKRSQRAVNSRGSSGGKGKHRQTDLRYATHYSEDTHIYSSGGEDDEDSLAITRATTAQSMNKKTSAATYKRGKKAKMLRFLDRRFARLHLTPSNDTSNNSNSNKNNQRRLDYEQQKAAWAAKYTSVKRLRKSFGSNKNRLWGDFDPTSTRRLYHTLLPRALLELKGLRDGLLSTKDDVEGRNVTIDEQDRRRKVKSKNRLPWSSKDNESNNIDVNSEENNYLQQELKELAPLAYQARLAAKKYARERSRLPGRIGSMLYDGYRSWRRYGKWKSTGMTWEQVWNKYEDQVLQEAMSELENGAAVDDEAKNAIFKSSTSEEKIEGVANSVTRGEDIDDEELTARICLRILERSVVTNGAIDKLFLKELAKEDGEEDEKEIERGSNKSVARKRRRVRRRRLRRREKRIQADLKAIEMKFDDDIRELLKYSTLATQEGEDRRSKRKRGAFFWKSDKSSDATDNEKREEEDVSVEEGISSSSDDSVSTATADTSVESVEQLAADILSDNEDVSSPAENDTSDSSNRDANKLRKLAIHEVFALRLLATTKQRLSLLQALPSLGGEGGVEDDISSADSEDDTSKDGQ